MIQSKDLIHNGLYKFNRCVWRYDSSSHTMRDVANGKNVISVNVEELVNFSPLPFNGGFLLNNGFLAENDESAMDEKVHYKLPEHWWFTIEKDSKGKYHISVSGGLILGDIKYAHELQAWFNLLGIKKETKNETKSK